MSAEEVDCEKFVLLAREGILALGAIHRDDGNAINDFNLDTHARWLLTDRTSPVI